MKPTKKEKQFIKNDLALVECFNRENIRIYVHSSDLNIDKEIDIGLLKDEKFLNLLFELLKYAELN